MFKGKKIAVVVQAYNEQRLVKKAICSVPDYVDKIIVVDDHSTDNTFKILTELKRKNRKIILLRHKKNKGVGAVTVTGYKEALRQNADITAIMAGDAQMDPKDLPALLAPIAKGEADYTKGNRLLAKDVKEVMPSLRYFGNSLLTVLNKIATGYWHLMDPQNGYTAISKAALEKLPIDKIYPRYGYPNDMLVNLNIYNFKVRDVPTRVVYGEEKSKIRLYSYIPKISFLLLRRFIFRLKEKYLVRDFHPLLLFYLFGFLLALAGILFAIRILYIEFLSSAPKMASTNEFVLAAFLLIIGFQSIFFAMWFDMEYNKE